MRQEIQRVETEDGSSTLYDARLDVHYRSRFGAVTESDHVFVLGTGLPQRSGPWTVLELGFGGGMNFSRTVRACREKAVALRYETLEFRPVPPDVIGAGSDEATQMVRESLQRASAGQVVEVTSGDGAVTLRVHVMHWRSFRATNLGAHAVFHDPFAPAVNENSWTPEAFRWAKSHLAEDGILATYSSARKTRTSMAAAGLTVVRTDGPGRKRDITYAATTLSALRTWIPRELRHG